MPLSTRGLLTTVSIAGAGALTAAALFGGMLIEQPSAAKTQAPVIHLTSSQSSNSSSGATITVSATGTAKGTPDTVTIQMGITANGSTATEALNTANQEMADIQAVFIKAHIAKAQLATSQLNLGPDYNQAGEITGYSGSEELTITMGDFAKAGALIDAAASVGGNYTHIDGINFSISNTSGILAAARSSAMQTAHAEAQELAAGAGVTLGSVKSVTDNEQQYQPTFYNGGMFAGADAAKSVPLMAGTQSENVNVTVVYNLNS